MIGLQLSKHFWAVLISGVANCVTEMFGEGGDKNKEVKGGKIFIFFFQGKKCVKSIKQSNDLINCWADHKSNHRSF